MACTLPPLDQLTNSQQFITQSELLTLAAGIGAAELSTALGIALIIDVELTPTPLAPFVWAATAIAVAVQEILGLFSGGRPKDQDTNSVIWAYHMSGYWPLQALGSNLAMALKNGAPISDSRPQIQAQFSAWKEGTVQSIQTMTGWTPGAGSPGYWQLHALINTSWAFSKNGNQATLNVVKAIDCWTELLYQLKAQGITPPTTPPPTPPTPGPPPPPPPPPPPTSNPCDSGNPDQDEILDLCNAVNSNLTAILAAIENLNLGGGTNNDSTCCTNVVAAILSVTQQLTVIATALAFPNSGPLNIDFTPVVTAIATLAAAVSADTPILQAIADSLNSGLPAIANAITNATGTDVSGIVEQLKALVREGDVKQPILDSLLAEGYITGADAQVLQGADWADSLIRLGRTALWTGWNWFLGVCGVDMTSGRPVLKPLGSTIADDLARAISFALGAGAAPLYPEVKGIIDAVTAQLQPTGLPTIGDVHVDPDLLLAKTLSPLLIVNAVAMVVDYFGWEISETLKQYTEWISEFVGLQEVRELKVGQMMRFGPMREAELRAKALYRQEIAGLGTMANWVARGLYDQGRARGLAPVLGVPIEQVAPALEAAYGGISAFILIRLLETGIYTRADLQDELTFSGMRPASQTRLLNGAAYLATETYRTKLEANLEAAHAAGLLTDQELLTGIDSAEQNYDRDSLILTASNYKKLVTIAKDLEAEYTTLYLGQLIDDVTFRSYLAGIGLQPDMVNAVASKAEARANATLHRKEIAAAAALQRATATVERQAALKNFEQGTLPLPLYVAALIETGLTPTQAAAWGDLAALKKQGNIRWLYGLQLTPDAATVLKQRVSALTDQRKRQLISQQQYVQALGQLGISDTWINALDATAEAMLTPKLSAFPVPVQT